MQLGDLEYFEFSAPLRCCSLVVAGLSEVDNDTTNQVLDSDRKTRHRRGASACVGPRLDCVHSLSAVTYSDLDIEA